MSAITFSLLTLTYEDLICYLTSKKIQLTFLILDPKSEEAKKHTSMYGSSDDLIPQILSSIQRLCKLKTAISEKCTDQDLPSKPR